MATVWVEDWEAWATGAMSVAAPVTALDGTPTITGTGIAGKSAQVGPAGNGFHVSVAGLSHWSLEFTAKMSGSISANHYIVSPRASGDVYIGDLGVRLSGRQVWNRINFNAAAAGKSTWTYANPSTVRIIYEWHNDEHTTAHLFHGANLNGTTPDETLVYDKTMDGGAFVGKRCATLRFGNNTTDGITSQFDNLILRDLTIPDAPALWVWNGTEYAAAQSVQVKHPVSGWIAPAQLLHRSPTDWQTIL